MLEINKTHIIDAREGLKLLDDESIDCVITSPPYWGLRDYGLEPQIWDGDENCQHEWGDKIPKHGKSNWDTFSDYRHDGGAGKRKIGEWSVTSGQFCIHCNAWRGSLGLEPTFQLYLQHLKQIFAEVKRVLKKTGNVWVNLGDTYGSPKSGDENKNIITRKREAVKGMNKSLCLIPERFIIMMVDELGFIARNKIVWWKRNCMPSSANDRFTVDWEPVFFFTKQRKYYFEQQFEAHTIETQMYFDKYIPEKAHDTKRRILANEFGVKIGGGFAGSRAETTSRMNPQGRNKRCVWDIPTQSFPESHFAVFPEKLVETPILAGCPKDGIVLDPFIGSGTVGKVALANRRNYIGFDLGYKKMSEKRTAVVQLEAFT